MSSIVISLAPSSFYLNYVVISVSRSSFGQSPSSVEDCKKNQNKFTDESNRVTSLEQLSLVEFSGE